MHAQGEHWGPGGDRYAQRRRAPLAVGASVLVAMAVRNGFPVRTSLAQCRVTRNACCMPARAKQLGSHGASACIVQRRTRRARRAQSAREGSARVPSVCSLTSPRWLPRSVPLSSRRRRHCAVARGAPRSPARRLPRSVSATRYRTHDRALNQRTLVAAWNMVGTSTTMKPPISQLLCSVPRPLCAATPRLLCCRSRPAAWLQRSCSRSAWWKTAS